LIQINRKPTVLLGLLTLFTFLVTACSSAPAQLTAIPSPVATRVVPEYYVQHREVLGIQIIAPETVLPLALERAAEIVMLMMSGRDGLTECMKSQRAVLAIIPENHFVTELPEFSHLSGRMDLNGNPYDSLNIRGLGAIPSNPVTATSEENLLKRPTDRFRNEDITVHEFAHALMNLCWSEADRKLWTDLYIASKDSVIFANTFSQVNIDEFFAEVSQSYFEVNNEIGGRSSLDLSNHDLLMALQEFYGE
jgi:hypothetical protein